MSAPTIAFAALVNDEAMLEANLLRSPALADGTHAFHAVRGAASAGAGLNAALDASDAEVTVLVHQDVYLPGPWLGSFADALAAIAAEDPGWGVAGVFGRDEGGALAGRAYDAGAGTTYDHARPAPVRASVLDEILLAVRRGGPRFDPALPGFHLYGTDICLTARARGRSAWVVSTDLVHNCRLHLATPPGYLAARRYLAAKWPERLPLETLVMPLDARPWAPMAYAARMAKKRWNARGRPPAPPPDAANLSRRLGYEA